MTQTSTSFRSSIGRKAVMAVTGLLLSLFLLAHMAGNMLAWAGPAAFNGYAWALKGNAGLLWTARVGLLLVFVVHVASALSLTAENRRARPVAYAREATIQASYASRTMLLTGLVVLAYLVLHLLHFTIGVVEPTAFASHTAEGKHDAYRMLVLGFRNPLLSGVYIVAMGFLWLHVSHGLTTLWQSLVWNHPRYRPLLERGGRAVAALIVLGFVSVPVSVLAGIIGLAEGGN
ncbi:MAG: succinate dehydrogenase cytochrome b subunit [Planctomycetota bacterium]